MGLSVVNKLEIDDVNYHFARRISYVASTGISEPVRAVAWSPDGNYLAAANIGVTVWQARGVDYEFDQIVQDTSGWGIARFAVLYFGVSLGGIALYEFVLTKRSPHFTTSKKRTRKRLVFSTLGRLSLYLIAFFVGGVVAFYLLITLGKVNATIGGIIAGSWLLETFVLPSVTLRFILPSFKRRPLHKKARSYAKQGKTLANQGKYLEALEAWNYAIALHSNRAAFYYARGIVYLQLKNYCQAAEDINRAIELRPNSILYYSNRAEVYVREGKYKEALADCNHVIASNQYDSDAYFDRGMVYLWLRNISDAKIDFIRSSELDSNNIEARLMNVWVGMGKQRSSKETADLLEHISTIAPQQYTGYICRGAALGLRGKIKEGIGEVEKAISLEPKKSVAYFWKGMLFAYFYTGVIHSEEAMESIEKSLLMGLPTILLIPLYWLEKDRPAFFDRYARPLLEKYQIEAEDQLL